MAASKWGGAKYEPLVDERIKIANILNRDYKSELLDFLLMYNVTPHGTTGKLPSELLYNRTIRDKIPSAVDISDYMDDSEVRDFDKRKKQEGKEREDKRRRAKEHELKIGDKVLLRNMTASSKLTPNFDSVEYEIKELKENDAIIAANGNSYRRNVSHLKKIPQEGNSESTLVPATMTMPVLPTTSQDSAIPVKVPPLKLLNKGGMWEPAPSSVRDSATTGE